MKILFAGRSARLSLLRQFLESEHHVVTLVETQDEAFEFAQSYSFDALVTELVLAQGTGDKLIRVLRNNKKMLPILALYPEAKYIISLPEVLDIGADDVMKMPIDKFELAARIRSVVRRPNGYTQSVLEVGVLTFDLDSKTLRVNGVPVHLSGIKISILEFFMLRVGRCVTREQLIDACWSNNNDFCERNVDVHVGRLRKLITDKSEGTIQGNEYIRPVYGKGYIMQKPEE